MKVLVINSGSSSLKFQLFDMAEEVVLASGLVEEIGNSNSKVKFEANGKKEEEKKEIKDHERGLELVNEFLLSSGAIKDLNEIHGVGHRVVHGGEKFVKPVIIDESVIKGIEEVSSLAPLHNPANLIGIKSAMQTSKNAKHVAVFDTSFHQSMPKEAYMYATPNEWYKEFSVRRYGFHGTSHKFVSTKAAEFLGIDQDKFNCITLHIGNGASACAIKGGKSIDTSMGLSPLEGLVMGTRSGDLDPAILAYIANKTKKDISQLDTILNKKSGLFGICGTNDMREVENGMKDDENKKLAYDMFCYRIAKYAGAYMAAIGEKVNAIIFTAGVGENSDFVRGSVCKRLAPFGIKLDEEKNAKREKCVRKISTDDSSIDVLVVPTNEELEIAQEVVKLVK